MLKDLFRNRLFVGALAFFIFCVVGGLLYMRHVEQQGAEYAAETRNRVAQWNGQENRTTEVEAGGTSQGGDFHKDRTSPAKPHAPGGAADSRVSAVSDVSEEELEFWKKLGVAPPPEGHFYAELADGTMRLKKKNVPIVSVGIKPVPRFNSGWLPDDAYHYYNALSGLSSGENLIGVGRIPPAETARAKEMLDAFEAEWAPHTSIGLSASGVYDTHDHDVIAALGSKAIAEKRRELEAELGISENRTHWEFDVDLMREILAHIREDLSK